MIEIDSLWWEDLLARSQRRQRRRAQLRHLWSFLKPGLLAIALLMSLYVSVFCCRFDVFSDPVINQDRGWLGPYIRGDRRTIDAGKAGYFESSDYALYDFYGPLCHVWIWCNVLNYHGA